MKRRIGPYPRVSIEGGGRVVVPQAGGVLLVETVRRTGLDTALSTALSPWRKARAVARSQVWELAGADAPAADGHVIVDIDGVLVLAHSEKQDAP